MALDRLVTARVATSGHRAANLWPGPKMQSGPSIDSGHRPGVRFAPFGVGTGRLGGLGRPRRRAFGVRVAYEVRGRPGSTGDGRPIR